MNDIQFQRGSVDASTAIGGGWELIKSNYWIFFGMTTLFIIGSFILSCIPFVGGILFQLVLAPPLTVGIYYTLLREMEHEPIDFGMMFKGFDKFGAAVVVGFINSIPALIWTVISFALNIGNALTQILQKQIGRGAGMDFAGQNDNAPLIAGGIIMVIVVVALVMFVFSIAWGISFFFALPLIADHDISPMDAIKLSLSAGWGNPGGIIVLFIFEILIGLVGILALCFGILFVIPILFAANAIVYRQVFPKIRRDRNFNPPPPTVYGDFGQGMA